jgi:hypothetical protein
VSSCAGRASIRCPGSWCPWWSWPLCLSWCSLLCPWPCALARFAALFLVLLPAVVGVVLLPVAARADRAAGLPVVVVALVVLVVGKEQGGRVIRGPGGSAWCRSWCRIAGGVAGVRLVVAG